MTKLVLCCTAAAFVAVALMSPAPALADMNYGPVKNGTQCWKDQPSRKGEFGYWSACPQTASVAAAPKQARKGRKL
jgi:hypothetical protein